MSKDKKDKIEQVFHPVKFLGVDNVDITPHSYLQNILNKFHKEMDELTEMNNDVIEDNSLYSPTYGCLINKSKVIEVKKL